MNDIIFLYSTAPDMGAAKKISSALIESGAAACVNLIPGMTSFYKWKGAVEQASEIVLIIKTTRDAASRARDLILAMHLYETPVIAALAVDPALSSCAFLDWIRRETRAPD